MNIYESLMVGLETTKEVDEVFFKESQHIIPSDEGNDSDKMRILCDLLEAANNRKAEILSLSESVHRELDAVLDVACDKWMEQVNYDYSPKEFVTESVLEQFKLHLRKALLSGLVASEFSLVYTNFEGSPNNLLSKIFEANRIYIAFNSNIQMSVSMNKVTFSACDSKGEVKSEVLYSNEGTLDPGPKLN